MSRRTATWLTGVDVIGAGLLAMAGLLLLLIGVSGDAGAFGAAVIPVVLLLLPAAPLVVTAAAARVAVRAPGRSGRWLAAAIVVFGVGVASLPLGEAGREWRDDRDVDRFAERLDDAAARCARERGTVTGTLRCIETDPELQPIVCNVDACWTSGRDEWRHAERRTVGVDLVPYVERRGRDADGIWYG